jgi:hypothetical protein
MIQTISVPFDHHGPRLGRRAFSRFATQLAARFPEPPQIIDSPVFSYRAGSLSRLNRPLSLDPVSPAIVYLSNIVMHSSVLVVGECYSDDLDHPMSYDSFESWRAAPRVVGYYVRDNDFTPARFDASTIVISPLACFRSRTSRPDPALFDILVESSGQVCAYRIRDFSRYLHDACAGGETAYFIPPLQRQTYSNT